MRHSWLDGWEDSKEFVQFELQIPELVMSTGRFDFALCNKD